MYDARLRALAEEGGVEPHTLRYPQFSRLVPEPSGIILHIKQRFFVLCAVPHLAPSKDCYETAHSMPMNATLYYGGGTRYLQPFTQWDFHLLCRGCYDSWQRILDSN